MARQPVGCETARNPKERVYRERNNFERSLSPRLGFRARTSASDGSRRTRGSAHVPAHTAHRLRERAVSAQGANGHGNGFAPQDARFSVHGRECLSLAPSRRGENPKRRARPAGPRRRCGPARSSVSSNSSRATTASFCAHPPHAPAPTSRVDACPPRTCRTRRAVRTTHGSQPYGRVPKRAQGWRAPIRRIGPRSPGADVGAAWNNGCTSDGDGIT